MARSKTRTRALLAGMVAVAALAAGCSRPKPPEPLPEARPGGEVAPLWDARRIVVLRASKGKTFTLRQLHQSIAFFEELTCLESDGQPGPYGLIPKQVLRSDLKRWDSWYLQHGTALSIDDRGAIVGGPPCPGD